MTYYTCTYIHIDVHVSNYISVFVFTFAKSTNEDSTSPFKDKKR